MSEHNHGEAEQASCRQLLGTLGDYVDGTLAAELCQTLELHMKDCRRCRIVVDTLRKTVALYQETARDAELPEDVRQRLYVKLNLDDFRK